MTILHAPLASSPSLSATRLERLLGAGAVLLLGFVVAAVVRGRAHWHDIPALIWAHLATIVRPSH